MSNFLPLAKFAAQAVTGLGVSKILGDIINNNVAITTTVQKVTVKVGSFVLGSMLVEATSKHIDRTVDEAMVTLEKFKKTDKETEE